MDYKDGDLICTFEIPGRPMTKKNHSRIIKVRGRFLIIPSEQYVTYEKHAKPYCEEAWTGEPLDFGLNVSVAVWLDNWRIPDQNGIMQSIGDILQKHGVIKDDKWIAWIQEDGHWLKGIDKENPRIIIKIYRFFHPYEHYCESKEKTPKTLSNDPLKVKPVKGCKGKKPPAE